MRTLMIGLLALCALDAAGGPACDPATRYPASPATHLNAWYGFLRAPTRLAIDAQDNVYVADPMNGRIVVRAPDGRIVEDLRGFAYPVSLALDSAGRLYVGEGNGGRVDVYGPDRSRVGVLGQGAGEFGLPAHIAVHEDGAGVRVFVSDAHADEVLAYDGASTARLFTIGGTGGGDGQFVFPSGVAVAAGELYVVDRGNSRLQVFGVDGAFRRVIAPPADNCGFLCFFEGASRGRARDAGIHVTPDGTIYLAEASKGRIAVLGPGGVGLGAIGDFGTAPGRLRVASDVVVDSCGRVFVASAGNGRVEVFGLPGHVDVETHAPAGVVVETDPLDPAVHTSLRVRLELPGQRLEDVTLVLANGFAQPVASEPGDVDGDNLPDLSLTFGPDLVQALAGTPQATLSLAGQVGALAFAATAEVRVLVHDGDGDGVDDPIDACPGTAAGATVDVRGCSIAQHCPCGQAPSGARKAGNHGGHVACVAHASREFERAGLLSPRERARLVREAAHARCGLPDTAAAGHPR